MTYISTLSTPLFSVGIIELIFLVIFVVFSILGQIFNKEKEPRPRQRPPNQPPGQDPADPLEAEIAEFVRRAQGGPEIIEAEPVPDRPVRRAERRLVEDGIRADASLESHVDRHMGSELTSVRPMLASQIEDRDEKMDAHLQEVFDHTLGKLKPDSRMEDAEMEESTTPRLSPSELRELFRSPDDIRKAIIMNEILTPQNDKWD